jgi:hypothetical protein
MESERLSVEKIERAVVKGNKKVKRKYEAILMHGIFLY